MATPALAQAEATRSFAIAPQPLSAALLQFSQATGIELLFDASLARGLSSPGVNGSMSAETALQRLLAGTGLVHRFNGANSVTLEKLRAGPGATMLGPVTVEAQRRETATGPVDGYVAQRSATATKTDTPLIETPQSISVITREQIEAQKPRSVTEAMRYTPGVRADGVGFQPESESFFVRGFQQSHLNFLRDGLRVAGSGSGAFHSVEPYGLERIEVLRGPASVLYGQTSPGGLVSLVSKRPTETAFREVELQGGNFDRKQAAFDLGGPIDSAGRFLYRVTGLARDSDSQVDFLPDDRLFLSVGLTWRPSTDTSLTFLADHHRDQSAFAFSVPGAGTVFPNPNGRIPSNRFIGEPEFDNDENRKSSIGYLFEHRVDDRFTVRQNFRYTSFDSDLREVTPAGFVAGQQRVINRSTFLRYSEADIAAVDNQLESRFRTGPLQHTLLAGLDYSRAQVDTAGGGVANAAGPLDLFAPSYGRLVLPPPITTSTAQDQEQIGLYVQDQIKFGAHWVLQGGGRHDWAALDSRNRLTNTSSGQDDRAFTGRVGLVYLSDLGLAPYASYSESFLPVTGTTAQGAPFQPETGQQYEIGIKYQPEGWTSFVTLALFDLTRQNVTTPDPANPLFNVQTGEVRSRGLEIEAKARLLPGLDVLAAYSFNDVEVTKSNGTDLGKRPARVPAHLASAWFDYTVQGGLFAGLGLGTGVRYVGAAPGDALNTFDVRPYTLVDAAIHYDFADFRLSLNAANLFDDDHIAACFTATNCAFGSRRTLIASLRYRW